MRNKKVYIGVKAQERLLQELESARRSATFKNSDFFGSHEKAIQLNSQLRERTRLYRESWIIAPIDRAIAVLKGEKKYDQR